MVRSICPSCGRDVLAEHALLYLTYGEVVVRVDDGERCPHCQRELMEDEEYVYVQPCRLPEVEPYLVHWGCRLPWEHLVYADRLSNRPTTAPQGAR